ncbi:MAG: YadA-like family protein [Cardiobacteriaceae bacterium]|nr:YadA-like family protein [Cardiobacteriaceae bacterium]
MNAKNTTATIKSKRLLLTLGVLSCVTQITANAQAPSGITANNQYTKNAQIGAASWNNNINAESNNKVCNDRATVWGYGNSAGGSSSECAVNTTAFGFKNQANGKNSTAFGNQSRANGEDSIAIGRSAIANGKTSFATGRFSYADGEDSAVFNHNSFAYANNSFAAAGGQVVQNKLKTNWDAIDTANTETDYGSKDVGQNSIAMGWKAWVAADDSVALGKDSEVHSEESFAVAGGNVSAEAKNSIALAGKTTVQNAVAIGSGSVADRNTGVTGRNPLGNAGSGVAWTSGLAAVSVGSSYGTRQIIGVAAGSEDSDAVNVAQLKAVADGAYWTAKTSATDSGYKVSAGKDVVFKGKDAGNISIERNDGVFEFAVDTADLTGNNLFYSDGKAQIANSEQAKLITANDAAKIANDVAWNLKNNGDDKTTVRNASTLDFIDGQNSKILVDTTENTSKIKVETAALNKSNNGLIEISGGDWNDTSKKYEDYVISLNTDGLKEQMQPIKFQANGTDSALISPDFGETVNFAGDKNITVKSIDGSAGDKKIAVSLNNAVNLGNDGSLTVGNSTLSNNGLAFDGNSGKIDGLAAHIDESGKAIDASGNFYPNQAASMQDLLNSGWELQVGGDKKQYVNQKDNKVNFAAGRGMTVEYENNSVTYKADVSGAKIENGKVTGITYNGEEYEIAQTTDTNTITTLTEKTGNIIVAKSGDNYDISLADNLSFTDAGSITFTNGNNPVVINKEGLNNGGNKIINVAAGTESTDAVNYGQLQAAVKQSAETASFNLSIDGNISGTKPEAYKVGKDKTVTIKAGDNLEVSQNNGEITLKTKESQTLDSLNITNTATYKGHEIVNEEYVKKLAWKVKGAGNEAADGKFESIDIKANDALTLQAGSGLTLKQTEGNFEFALNKATNHRVNNGQIEGGKQDEYWDSLQTANAINDATSSLGFYVTGGDNVVGADRKLIKNGGGLKISAATGVKIEQKSDDQNGGTEFLIGLDDENQNNLDSAMQGFQTRVIANGQTTVAQNIDKEKNTADFLQGSNIVLTASDGGITVATADKVTFDTVNANTVETEKLSASNTKLSGNTTIADIATYTGRIEEKTDLVNKEYVDNAVSGIKLTPTEVKQGKNTQIVGQNNTYTVDAYDTQLASKSQLLDVTGGDLNNDLVREYQLDVKTSKLTAQDGKVKADGDNLTTASNVAEVMNQAYWTASDGKNDKQIKLGEGISFVGANGITVDNNDGQFTIGFNGNAGGNGKTTTISNTDKNLNITSSASGDTTNYEVNLNNQIALGADGEISAGSTLMNADGISLGSGVGLYDTGLDNAGYRVTNVGNAVEDSDAVNLGQLRNALGTVVAPSLGAMEGRINQRIDSVDRHASAGIAQSIAAAVMPHSALPGEGVMGVSGGSYRGETGYAIGYSHMSDNGNWRFKATGSGNSRGHYGVAAGIGWRLY